MVTTLRVAVVLSIAALLIGTLLPFERPLQIDLPLDGPPPIWLPALLGFVVMVLVAVAAAVGLFRFRRWGRVLAVVVALAGLLAFSLLARSPLAGVVNDLAPPLLAFAALAWLVAVGFAFHPALSSRFRK